MRKLTKAVGRTGRTGTGRYLGDGGNKDLVRAGASIVTEGPTFYNVVLPDAGGRAAYLR